MTRSQEPLHSRRLVWRTGILSCVFLAGIVWIHSLAGDPAPGEFRIETLDAASICPNGITVCPLIGECVVNG